MDGLSPIDYALPIGLTLLKCHKGTTDKNTTTRKRRCALLHQKWSREVIIVGPMHPFKGLCVVTQSVGHFSFYLLLDNGNDSVILESQPKKSAVSVYCRQSKEINYRYTIYLSV